MRSSSSKFPVVLATYWKTARHGAITFVVGAVFLLAFSLTGEEPEAFYGAKDPSEAGTVALEESPAIPGDGPNRDRDPASIPNASPSKPPSMPDSVAEPSWRKYKIAKRDTVGGILRKITDDEEAIRYLLPLDLKSYRRIRPGKMIEYKTEDGKLIELRYKTSPDYYLHFKRSRDGELRATEEPPKVSATEVRKTAAIESSLYEAMDAVGVGANAIDGLVTALETHIDFHRDLRKGDRFEMIYDEERDEDGVLINTTRPKAFVAFNRGREIVGVYSPDAGGYYSPEGESLQRAFLRSPLKFSRVSSKFTLRRYHPVLKTWRAHRGVDYAARTGTPVRASGDGIVKHVRKERGYGNVVYLQHYNIYTTVYGHLSRFAKGIKKGKRVAQGEVIGYVGSTGLSTGPHLHYEFRKNNKHIDPLSAAVPVQLPSLSGKDLEDFRDFAAPYFARLDLYEPEEVALQD